MFNQIIISIKKNYFTLILIVLLFVYIIFYISFLPFPGPVILGLDPSWTYAISKAAEDNLIFGKDIVFTYGPFGYLIHGSSLESNFWEILTFQWSTQLSFFLIILIRIMTLKNKIAKILLFLSVAVVIYFLKINFWTSLIALDYQILYAYLTIFTFDSVWKKYPIQMSCLMGIISGFCLLTKFTLGIYTFGFLILFNSVNLYRAIIVKSRKKIGIIILAIIMAILAFFSSAWVGLVPNQFLESLTKISINIIISILITWVLFFSIKKNQNRILKIKNKSINYWSINLQSQWLVIPIIFCLIYAILTTHTILFVSSASLKDYIYNYLQISLGYSSAMSKIGNSTELIIGLSNCMIVIWILFLLAKDRYLNLSLGFLFIILIAFKHGFIRHGSSHYLLFSQTILFIVPLCLTKIKSIRIWKISFCLYLYIIVNSMVMLNGYSDMSDSIFTRLNNNWRRILNLEWVENNNERYSMEQLSKAKFPDKINEILLDKKVDIIPWDISIAPANNLNWHPRPIFQSYSAYTSYLDNLNFQSFVNNPREYLLYSFDAIDGRHPFFDEPKTFSFVYCNYDQIEVIESEFKPFILLKKLSENRCSATTTDNKIITKWNQVESIENPNQSIIQAQVKIKYSLWGKLYKTIFRAPPVYIKVQYNNNTEKSYRIIPAKCK